MCPESEPAVFGACQHAGLECEYGNAWWNVSCDDVFECMNGQWQTVEPNGLSTCEPAPGPNPSSCPADQGGFTEGSQCAVPGVDCFYGQGLNCICGVVGDASVWGCTAPGCPTSRPRLGAGCNITNVCGYGPNGFTEGCSGGIWYPASGP